MVEWHPIHASLKLSGYRVSREGQVLCVKTGHTLDPTPQKGTGHVRTALKLDDGSRRPFRLHQIVASTFLPLQEG
jgi:hypothetical protein